MMDLDSQVRVLQIVERHPQITQRDLAHRLGVSIGKANYCVNALIERGWIKASNFKNSNNKIAYAYLLTPQGIRAKTRITLRFLERKVAEYEALEKEIIELRQDIKRTSAHP